MLIEIQLLKTSKYSTITAWKCSGVQTITLKAPSPKIIFLIFPVKFCAYLFFWRKKKSGQVSNTALYFFSQSKNIDEQMAVVDRPMVGQSHNDHAKNRAAAAHPWARDCHMMDIRTIVGCKDAWSQQMTSGSSHIFTLRSLFIGELLALLIGWYRELVVSRHSKRDPIHLFRFD